MTAPNPKAMTLDDLKEAVKFMRKNDMLRDDQGALCLVHVSNWHLVEDYAIKHKIPLTWRDDCPCYLIDDTLYIQGGSIRQFRDK